MEKQNLINIENKKPTNGSCDNGLIVKHHGRIRTETTCHAYITSLP